MPGAGAAAFASPGLGITIMPLASSMASSSASAWARARARRDASRHRRPASPRNSRTDARCPAQNALATLRLRAICRRRRCIRRLRHFSDSGGIGFGVAGNHDGAAVPLRERNRRGTHESATSSDTLAAPRAERPSTPTAAAKRRATPCALRASASDGCLTDLLISFLSLTRDVSIRCDSRFETRTDRQIEFLDIRRRGQASNRGPVPRLFVGLVIAHRS